MMPWILLFVASVLEIVWAFAMKRSAGFTRIVPTLVTFVAMVTSFGLLSLAMKSLPLGTAYPVWTGIGAVGTFVVGLAILGEPLTLGRVTGAGLIVCGLVVMMMSTGR